MVTLTVGHGSCGGLNKNGFRRLTYVNSESSRSDTI